MKPGLLRAGGLCAAFVLCSLAVAKRDVIVRAAPQLAGTFASIGLPVNVQGLELRDIKSRVLGDSPQPVLAVEGEIRNLKDRSMPVPDLQLSLRDAAGQEIYVWKAPPPKASLGKGETVYFRARLAAPPEAANAVRIQFADVTPATAKKRP